MDIRVFNNLLENELGTYNMLYNPEDDKINKLNISDTRKNKLTLKNLNKLKKMRTAKRIENTNKKHILGIMYATPTDDN